MKNMKIHHIILYILMMSVITPARGQKVLGSDIVSRMVL